MVITCKLFTYIVYLDGKFISNIYDITKVIQMINNLTVVLVTTKISNKTTVSI